MRGAPQVGFSATIRKIKARTSLLRRFRPPTWLILETHVQYKRNPARCQFTTVLGVTKTRGCLHPDQHILNATQNSLCRAVNRRRGRCACSASNCRRRAMFSRTRSARQLKELTNQRRKCRSDTIMAKNFSGKGRIKLYAKSLISQVYDLLARHNPEACSVVIFERLWESVRADAEPSLVRQLDCQFQVARAIHINEVGFYKLTTEELAK